MPATDLRGELRNTDLPGRERWPAAYRVTFALAVLATAVVYLWCARASNGPFDWRGGHPGFYDLLAGSLVEGHLYLPIEPSAELLALPNPWDPQRNQQSGVHDLVLYHRHYYLFHGVTPAVLAFAPFRFLTGRDLPEAFAVWLFCLLGYICGCATLMRWLAWAGIRPRLALFALLLLALAVCQSAPFLLQRVDMYEIAVAGGYFCVSAGFWFLTRGILRAGAGMTSFALAGLCLGLAAGCRPNLAFTGICSGAMILWYLSRQGGVRAAWRRPEWWAFASSLAACGLLLALYNYARFDNPLEFGTTWQIAPPNYFRPTVSFKNLVPGLYYLLACTPTIDGVFPFYRLALRMPFNNAAYPLHAHFFREPVVGLFVIWPLSVLVAATPWVIRRRGDARLRALLGAVCSSAIASLFLVAALGLATQRFHLDWLPYLILVSCFLLAVLMETEHPSPVARHLTRVGGTLAVLTIIYSIFANLSLGIQGPFDNFVRVHPDRYVKYASWFSPARRLRLLYNPEVHVEATFFVPPRPVGGALPLISAGWFGSRYLLTAEMLGNGRGRLTSTVTVLGVNELSAEVPVIPGAPNRVLLEYEPPSRTVSVRWNGALALRHVLPYLVTAPAQLRVGEDRAEIDPTPLRYPWAVRVLTLRIEDGSQRQNRTRGAREPVRLALADW